MRQYAGFGSARESNRRYRYLLEQGQTGLSVAFDLPTQMGYDSDDPAARGRGRQGRRRHRDDRGHADPDRGPARSTASRSRMTINSTAVDPARAPAVGGARAGDRLEGPLGHGPERPAQGVRRARDLHLSARGPRSRSRPTSSRSAAPRCRAGTRSRSPATTSARPGSTAVQEVAFTLSNAIAYVEAALGARASRSTTWRRGCRSSSTPTPTSSRRSRSSARRARSGPRSRATASARRTRVPGACASTRRRRARR